MSTLVKSLNHIVYATFIFLGMATVGCTEEPAPIAVTSVTLDSTSMTLEEGGSQKLTATISPSNAENKAVIWTSSNSSVASVKDGLVTAIKSGKATITVKSDDGGKTATCEVTVNAKVYQVESVSLDKTLYEMTEGDEFTLTATVKPDNATNKNVTWSSSNTSVATVLNGKVTALRAGAAIITVTTEDGGKTATCEVTVNAKVYQVESVSLDKTLYEMTEGDQFTLTATVKPDNATNKNVTWSSNNTSIVTVDNGKLTALKAGTAIITVKTEDGGKTATCEVTVNAKINPVESVSLDKTSYEMTEGEEFSLTATVKPDNATNKNVTWSSNNTSVAIVSNGTVTAKKAGTATITVKTEDRGKIATCKVTIKANYVDEYGVNHGPGIKIDETIWAPVNCGYHATDYKYGKLYQWGRKYGQGYDESDATFPSKEAGTIKEGGVSLAEGQSQSNKNIFFLSNPNISSKDWAYPSNSQLWNIGSEASPIKNNENDPCPDGWRVPTQKELKELTKCHSVFTTNTLGQNGLWFSGSILYAEDVPRVFFSAAGKRWHNGGKTGRDSELYYWSSLTEEWAVYLYYHSSITYLGYGQWPRAYGMSVRCVQE